MPKVLSLFSGCGGMDIGFEGGFKLPFPSIVNGEETCFVPETGFTTVFANDISKFAKVAWESFFRRKDVFIVASIVDLVKKHREGTFSFPEADIVTGGFPCQDFSVAGKRMGFKSQKLHHGDFSKDYSDPTMENRGMLYFWMKEVISIVKPKIFIAENVKGLESLGNVKEIIKRDFSTVDCGYLVKAITLNAADFGVPQNRERVIFIGLSKKDLSLEEIETIEKEDFSFFPNPPYSAKDGVVNTVGKAISSLPEPSLSEDQSHQKYSGAKWYGSHCQGNIEIKMDGLAPTIRSEHHGNIEFRRLSQENGGLIFDEYHLPQRRLSVRECARLQSFPDSYDFVQTGVSATNAYKLVGNAVPPLMGYYIASKVMDLFMRFYDINHSIYGHSTKWQEVKQFSNKSVRS